MLVLTRRQVRKYKNRKRHKNHRVKDRQYSNQTSVLMTQKHMFTRHLKS